MIFISDIFRNLTIGIRELSFAKEGEKFLAFFCIFFLEKKKRRRRSSGSDMKIFELNLEKQIGYLNSYQKNTQFQKTNHPKRILRNKLMGILNLTIFQVFFPEKAVQFA